MPTASFPRESSLQSFGEDVLVAAAAPLTTISAKNIPAPLEGLCMAHQDTILFLHKPHGPLVDRLLLILEKIGLKREYLLYSLAFCLIYTATSSWGPLLSNLIGFVYPAFVSLQIVHYRQQEEGMVWLMYWTTFALIFLLDPLVELFLPLFPFYYVIKTLFLIYLWLPQTMGARYVYDRFIDPVAMSLERKFV